MLYPSFVFLISNGNCADKYFAKKIVSKPKESFFLNTFLD